MIIADNLETTRARITVRGDQGVRVDLETGFSVGVGVFDWSDAFYATGTAKNKPATFLLTRMQRFSGKLAMNFTWNGQVTIMIEF